MGRLWRRAALAAGLALLPAMPARASSLQFCDRQAEPTVVERDTLLRFAAVVRDQLDAAGSAVAIVARSGTDLRRFGAR